jgi:hypothetical protein
MGFHVRRKRKAKISKTTSDWWMGVRAPRVTGIQVEELRNRFGYSPDQIADLLGFRKSAISTLLASSDPLPQNLCERIWAVQHTLQFVPKNKRKVGRRHGPTADTQKRIRLAAECAVRGWSERRMARLLYPKKQGSPYVNVRGIFHSYRQQIEAEKKRFSPGEALNMVEQYARPPEDK